MITDAMVERAVRAAYGNVYIDPKKPLALMVRKMLEAALDPVQAHGWLWSFDAQESFPDAGEAMENADPYDIQPFDANCTLGMVFAVRLPEDGTEDPDDAFLEAQLFRTLAEAEAAVAKWRGMASDEQAAE